MAERPHVIVAGLGRCGSSATMRMLDRAGVPCIGSAPGYEVEEVCHAPVNQDWLESRRGHAFKLLDPHLTPLPDLDPTPICFWLDRDPRQQALSQAKLACAFMQAPYPNRQHLLRWEAGLRKERKLSIARLPAKPVLLDFGVMVYAPHQFAGRIAETLRPWWPDLDWRAMAGVIRPRDARCAPDLSIELEGAAHG